MAVARQQNFLGQERLDIPHVRAIESGAAYDFDVLAGLMLAGGTPQVIKGFTFVTAGAVGKDAEDLVLQVAASSMIHYFATESGSIFRVPIDRDNETLAPTNAKVFGSFTPGAVNFVGIDLIRAVDDNTADTAQFLIPTTNREKARVVPMARTMDYRIVVSTTEFSATPGLAPIGKITTDASNKVLDITDARNLMFRLGSGGSSPDPVNPFGWPGGRNEAIAAQAAIGGDRSITDLKQWMNATMTKLWELGGGEYWYSLSADRNVHMSSPSRFSTTLEPFEVVALNVHWQRLVFSFDNSTGVTNEIDEQLIDSPGITDLADGECLFVDLDRTQDRTVADLNPLTPDIAPIRSLGGSARPGNRWIFAWRIGSDFYVAGQVWPVGWAFHAATMTTRGTVRLTADPLSAPDIADPVVPVVLGAPGWITAGGLSHNTDLTSGDVLIGSNLTIGRGTAAGDAVITLHTDGGNSTVVEGNSSNAFESGAAALIVSQDEPGVDGSTNNITLDLIGRDSNAPSNAYRGAHRFEVGGAVGFRNVSQQPETPAPTTGVPIRSKLFFRTNGLASPATRDQMCVMWWDGGTPTVIAESNPY